MLRALGNGAFDVDDISFSSFSSRKQSKVLCLMFAKVIRFRKLSFFKEYDRVDISRLIACFRGIILVSDKKL